MRRNLRLSPARSCAAMAVIVAAIAVCPAQIAAIDRINPALPLGASCKMRE
jgi:hypothetical protein